MNNSAAQPAGFTKERLFGIKLYVNNDPGNIRIFFPGRIVSHLGWKCGSHERTRLGYSSNTYLSTEGVDYSGDNHLPATITLREVKSTVHTITGQPVRKPGHVLTRHGTGGRITLGGLRYNKLPSTECIAYRLANGEVLIECPINLTESRVKHMSAYPVAAATPASEYPAESVMKKIRAQLRRATPDEIIDQWVHAFKKMTDAGVSEAVAERFCNKYFPKKN